ncbi:SDR family NAD(P)-dependent oxidoreductase [Bacillus sp. FJAT-50079]|uniref:SDR family NAD(P)-dependent oxidoreductase n=1 Tax=Bacillus sp. FJAT-50079 TaxID=2833577 RepID=UPI001BC8F0B0|nr:SDR family NAD(P)-dependent oxidoreductase [Bacillus sp. FJAT-50079]MBS4208241.1 SDR family oxidoreductase [Bacillus sp. FJAT-50079]
MEIDLKGKVAIVTGVGKGIGREIFFTLAEEGVRTVGIDINSADLDELGKELINRGLKGSLFLCDIRNSRGISKVVDKVIEKYDRIDILVNNAGIAGNGKVEELSEETWDNCQDVNAKGTFLMCKAVAPIMKRQNYGRILNAASFAAIIPSIGSAAYAASKAGVKQFTRVLAGELAPWNITVNSYAPGMIPSTLNNFSTLPADEQNQLLNTLTIRKWGKEKDVANLICFLASDLASYITGTMIDISGGKYATQFPNVAYE